MGNTTANTDRINQILQKTIDSIESSKAEIIEVVEQTKDNVTSAEEKLETIKEQVKEVIEEVDKLEIKERKSRTNLAKVNKNFDVYSENDLKEAYVSANDVRVNLLLKREQERTLIKSRRESELALDSAIKIYEKSMAVWKSISVANEYLKGNSDEILVTVDNLDKKQDLIFKMIEVQEEEKQKLAMDIHDGPAQSLANIVIKTELCERYIDVDKEKAKDEMANLKKLTRDTLNDIRETIYDLRPMSLDDLGLIPTIEKHIERFNQNTGISIDFKAIGQAIKLESSIQITIYRIIQESLNNISKHSKASEGKVIIEFSPNRLNLYIADNGIGFDYDKMYCSDTSRTGKFGIANMKERIELIGGNFKIRTSPGNGTIISIYILLTEEEN